MQIVHSALKLCGKNYVMTRSNEIKFICLIVFIKIQCFLHINPDVYHLPVQKMFSVFVSLAAQSFARQESHQHLTLSGVTLQLITC